LEIETLIDQLKEVLVEQGITVLLIEPVLPALEDVFVSMVDAENRVHLRSELRQGEEE